MSTRTANWVSHTRPGSAPPPPSRAPTAPPPPTIYPESSVSNPNASRYTRRPSRSQSVSSSHRTASSHHTAGSGSRHGSSHHGGGSSYHSSGSHHTARQPMQTFYANPEEPIIAKTSTASGRTSSYMIIPAHGQKVEILQPKRAATIPVTASSSSSYYSSTRKEEPLLKRLFNKVEWNADNKSSSGRSRRHSTGGPTVVSGRSGGYSVISGRSSAHGNTVISGSGTRVTSASGRVYEVHYA